jgi:hypothetical protein
VLSASISLKSGKICYFLLLHHFFNLSLKDRLLFLILVTLLIAAIAISIKIVVLVIKAIFYDDWGSNIFEFGSNVLLIVILKIIYPFYFFKTSIRIIRKIRKIIVKSTISTLNISIHPTSIIDGY